MTYIVTEACIKCKYMDCVEVCPVDCFYEGENMLVIHPRRMHRLRRVRAGVPRPRRSCPIPTARPSGGSCSTGTTARPGPTSPARARRRADADEFNGVAGKYDKYFSDKPGIGDAS